MNTYCCVDLLQILQLAGEKYIENKIQVNKRKKKPKTLDDMDINFSASF